MIVIPQAFFQDPSLNILLMDGQNGVLRKSVRSVQSDNDRYLTANALTIVLQGGLTVEPYEGQVVQVEQGEMILLPKGLYLISDVLPKGRSFEAYVFFFDEGLTARFLDSVVGAEPSEEPNQGLLKMSVGEELRIFLEGLERLYGQAEPADFVVTNIKLLELLHLIGRSEWASLFIERLKAAKRKSKQPIGKFMAENYDKPLNIEDFAYLTGRSLSSFHRDFKRTYKKAPKRWLIEKRLEKARRLLKSDLEKSVTQVAMESGYENLSHFIKAFRRQYAISPKQYQVQERIGKA